MTTLQASRSWAVVHATWPGVIVLVLCTAATPFMVVIHAGTVGVFSVPADTPIGILMPLPLSVAVALGCTYRADPRIVAVAAAGGRVVAARLGWLILWLVPAFAVTLLASHTSYLATPAVMANQALCLGLALLMVTRGWSGFAWLPGTIIFAVAMTFGYRSDSDDFSWWAVIMQPTCSLTRAIISIGIMAVSATVYVAALPKQTEATVA